jgi:4-hydroxy-4-methyl-2-oxoglutarate aldolase
VRCLPGDFAAVLRAIDKAKRGDVLVIDGGGSDRVTAIGGTSSLACRTRGLAGVVVNAACRDVDEIRAMRFPVYALGTSVRGTLKNHPGWLQVPVSVGGVVVHPGDFVIGDADGVVVVEKKRIAEVAKKALAQRAAETDKESRVRKGASLVKMFNLEALES